jgi:hypothetical protein
MSPDVHRQFLSFHTALLLLGVRSPLCVCCRLQDRQMLVAFLLQKQGVVAEVSG